MLMPSRAVRIRKDPTRNELARRGVVAVLVIVVLLALVRLQSAGAFGGPPEVAADLRNAGGSLAPGSDVKVHGVIVGRVASIERGPRGLVRVRMSMDGDLLGEVPGDVVARILPATVFGTSFVDLRPRGRAGGPAHLARGAVIPADTTQGTLELQQALDDIDRLTKALGPAELATAIGSASVALAGRGEQLGRTAERLDDYLTRLNPEMDVVRADLRQLAGFLQIVQEIAPELLQATDDSLVVLNDLVKHRGDLDAFLRSGTSLASASDRLLKTNTKDLVQLIENGHRLLDAIYDNRRAGITGSIRANARIGAIVDRAIEEGYIKVDGVVQLDAPPYYGPGDRPGAGGGR